MNMAKARICRVGAGGRHRLAFNGMVALGGSHPLDR
jgi:hypothetical protein